MKTAAFAVALLISFSAAAEWKVVERNNPEGPGKAVDALEDGRVIARLIYGEGQIKPFLHVFGEKGEVLTNAGTDQKGSPAGRYPHHRGIFIGWKIISELGTDDLWHMTKGCSMELVALEKTEGGKESARIIADVAWRSAKKDANGSNILLREKRTLILSRPAKRQIQIDALSALMPQRDLRLAGDLQHSGVHFRAHDEVNDRQSETSYLAEPSGKAKGDDLKWCRLVFPVRDQWYSALQINHPQNPVEELSTRNYGRFGYFFKKELKKDETLALKYRFIVEPTAGKPAPEQLETARQQSQKLYREFVQAR